MQWSSGSWTDALWHALLGRAPLRTWNAECASTRRSRRPHKHGGEPLRPAKEIIRRAAGARSSTASA
eukprot:13246545-Alexandrium_andersonii.AAC.1